MSLVVLLDTGPLGLVTNPKGGVKSAACALWLQRLFATNTRIIIPEIADYEVRRELLRARKIKGLAKLDAFLEELEYLPITTAAMRQAALFWAQTRQKGKPTASDKTIDADMILAGQASTLGVSDMVIATTNVRHLNNLVSAEEWEKIKVT